MTFMEKFITTILGLSLAFMMGVIAGQNVYRVEAIKRGAAEWVICDDQGNTKFVWKLPETSMVDTAKGE
ncbi:MAG TPA: hypothetical protein PLA71_00950 [Saccharofermentans sp.]|nr:hypothetical protein [Saccharofermentans sp.]